MNKDITTKIQRIKDRTLRLCDDLKRNDPIQGMADAAELATIADFLWQDFRKLTDALPVKITPENKQG